MYTRRTLLTFLNIKNIIFFIGGMVSIILAVTDMLALYIYYDGDMEVMRYARRTPECIAMATYGVIAVLYAVYSRRKISNARFYSSYFECDLDGRIEFEDLSAVTGKNALLIGLELKTIMHIYMKRYLVVNDNGKDRVELFSKKILCSCKHCGAQIEKSEYFTGICPYCRGSNLYARVITDNKFYSITTEFSGNNKKDYYVKKGLNVKKALAIVFFSIVLILIMIFAMFMASRIHDYTHYEAFYKKYLHGVIFEGKPMKNYGDISKRALRDDAVMAFGFILALSVFAKFFFGIIYYAFISERFSIYLSKCKRPFVKARNMAKSVKMKKPFKYADRSIRRGYMKNCTFEKHGNEILLALAKKIQKDICPYCGGAITGAVDDNYKCHYCDRRIMDVVVKQD